MGSPFDLSGKVALVTGGNRGIGLGMARSLARAGSDVVIWGRDPARNREAEAELSAMPIRVLSQTVDVSVEAQVVRAMAEAVDGMGRLDTAIANAGSPPAGAAPWEAVSADLRRVLGVNLDGVFWTLREAGKAMIARSKTGDPGGSLLVVSSGAALRGASRSADYSASKAAILGLMRSLAVDYAPHGIRVNGILPGFINTEMMSGNVDPSILERYYLPRIPLGRMGSSDDLGGVAVYLASDASAYHTGDTLAIDGGFGIN
jgi:NAD(P)-dependent dehydrogenase (short-subunit alcohol dehydrogenase family)